MIKEGAKLVADYTDILEELNLPDIGELGLSRGKREEAPVASASAEDSGVEELDGLDEEEGALLALVSDQPVHVDDLCRQSGIPIASISSMLTLLELKGRVTQVGSMHYVRASALGVTHGS
jgi:DNA processing protein